MSYFMLFKDRGAFVNGQALKTSQEPFGHMVIALGLPYAKNDTYVRDLGSVVNIAKECYAIRHCGAIALDLAYVAAGRTDGFFEIGLGPWDTAAGTLLIEEAGGRVGTLSGGEYTQGGNIIAGSPKVYDALVALCKPHLTDTLREG